MALVWRRTYQPTEYLIPYLPVHRSVPCWCSDEIAQTDMALRIPLRVLGFRQFVLHCFPIVGIRSGSAKNMVDKALSNWFYPSILWVSIERILFILPPNPAHASMHSPLKRVSASSVMSIIADKAQLQFALPSSVKRVRWCSYAERHFGAIFQCCWVASARQPVNAIQCLLVMHAGSCFSDIRIVERNCSTNRAGQMELPRVFRL